MTSNPLSLLLSTPFLNIPLGLLWCEDNFGSEMVHKRITVQEAYDLATYVTAPLLFTHSYITPIILHSSHLHLALCIYRMIMRHSINPNSNGTRNTAIAWVEVWHRNRNRI
jgi:hypothetical protein